MFCDSNLTSFITTCTVFAAFLSVAYQAYFQSLQLTKVTSIVTSLVNLEDNKVANTRVSQARVFVGFGSSTDVYVDAADILKDAPADWEKIQVENQVDDVGASNYVISNEVDLWNCLAKYMRGEVSGR